MNELLEKFNRLQRNEQIALLAAGLLLALLLVWLLLIRPFEKQREQLHRNIAAAEANLAQVQDMVKAIQRQGAAVSAPSGESINAVVEASARQLGLTLNNIQPGSAGNVRVHLGKANYTAFMQWLQDLEFTHQIIIKEMSVVPSDEPGLINANLRLQK